MEHLTEVISIALAILALGFAAKFYLQSKQEQIYKELFDMSQEDQQRLIQKNQELLDQIVQLKILLERGNDAMINSQRALEDLENKRRFLEEALEFQKSQYDKLLSQKKSSEVRTGKIAEQMAPFIQDYPLPVETAKFIGDPIDFVHFLADKVVFVEVKSGKSRLTKKQRIIRDLIREGKVEFLIYQLGEEGPDVKGDG